MKIALVTDDTSPGRWEPSRIMTTPIVTENPLRLTPVDRDSFCDQATMTEPATATAPTRAQAATGSATPRR